MANCRAHCTPCMYRGHSDTVQWRRAAVVAHCSYWGTSAASMEASIACLPAGVGRFANTASCSWMFNQRSAYLSVRSQWSRRLPVETPLRASAVSASRGRVPCVGTVISLQLRACHMARCPVGAVGGLRRCWEHRCSAGSLAAFSTQTIRALPLAGAAWAANIACLQRATLAVVCQGPRHMVHGFTGWAGTRGAR